MNDSPLSGVAWVMHILSFFAIGGSLFGIIPAVAAILAIVWYLIEIFESPTLQKFIRSRRLRKLVRLRAKAVALELMVREQNFDLRGLDEANQVHLAAAGKAATLTHEALQSEQSEKVQKLASEQRVKESQRIEKALLDLKPSD